MSFFTYALVVGLAVLVDAGFFGVACALSLDSAPSWSKLPGGGVVWLLLLLLRQ
jgi:hypothetical protein